MSALSAFANIGKVPELRRRIIFTVVLLAVYRIGVFVTIPGVDRTVMNAVIHKQGGGLLGLFNMFSGGALGNLSIFALGIMPYISASIIIQLLTVVIPPLERLNREGEQ
ncbi:MAG: preprotein translocase subunit SecY, partial [Myxococcales bacterium]|nr:preprotein translocase subunit SecY [Myxococcales bacterium]